MADGGTARAGGWTGWLAGLALALLATAAPAAAQDAADAIVAELRAEGFEDIAVSRTLLRRIHIVATSPEGTREIVLDLATGQVLRDQFTPASRKAALP